MEFLFHRVRLCERHFPAHFSSTADILDHSAGNLGGDFQGGESAILLNNSLLLSSLRLISPSIEILGRQPILKPLAGRLVISLFPSTLRCSKTHFLTPFIVEQLANLHNNLKTNSRGVLLYIRPQVRRTFQGQEHLHPLDFRRKPER
jgi:hypothetical protein